MKTESTVTSNNKQYASNRINFLDEFEKAPDSALFKQEMPAAILGYSSAKLERDRWAGVGIPFVKIGHAVRYRKSDIVDFLAKHPSTQSTTQSKQAERV